MNSFDLKLRLLAGEPLKVGDIEIKPVSVRKIVGIGYSVYSYYLGVLILKPEDLIGDKEKIPKDVNIFDIIIGYGQKSLKMDLLNALSFFLNEKEIHFKKSEQGFIFGDIDTSKVLVNSTNFGEIVEAIKYQNCVIEPKEEEENSNPVDERTRKLMERMKKSREVVKKAKAKQNGNDDVDFISIISSVSTKSNTISKLNVWDLNIYQLYDEYKRLEMVSNYDTSILAMINGADIKNLKHWSSKFEE